MSFFNQEIKRNHSYKFIAFGAMLLVGIISFNGYSQSCPIDSTFSFTPDPIPAPIVAGQKVTVTLKITNTSNSTLDNVSIDTNPFGLDSIGSPAFPPTNISITQGTGTCSLGQFGSAICDFTGTIPPNGMAEMQFEIELSPNWTAAVVGFSANIDYSQNGQNGSCFHEGANPVDGVDLTTGGFAPVDPQLSCNACVDEMRKLNDKIIQAGWLLQSALDLLAGPNPNLIEAFNRINDVLQIINHAKLQYEVLLNDLCPGIDPAHLPGLQAAISALTIYSGELLSLQATAFTNILAANDLNNPTTPQDAAGNILADAASVQRNLLLSPPSYVENNFFDLCP